MPTLRLPLCSAAPAAPEPSRGSQTGEEELGLPRAPGLHKPEAQRTRAQFTGKQCRGPSRQALH
jgi:hypothetical protein